MLNKFDSLESFEEWLDKNGEPEKFTLVMFKESEYISVRLYDEEI